MLTSRRSLIPLVIAAAVLIGACASHAHTLRAHTAAATTATASRSAVPAVGTPAIPRATRTFSVSVTRAPVSREIPADFLGIALEFGTLPEWTAARGQAANTTFDALLRNLSSAGHPSLRLGGQSTDRTWWPVKGVRRPIGVGAEVGPAWVRSMRQLVSATGARLLLGVNLEANSPLIARVEADELVKGIGASNIQALQIGNEPNLYLDTPWYRTEDGHLEKWYSGLGTPHYSRAPSWGPSAFVTQFSQFARVMPNLPLSGPETGTDSTPWIAAFDRIVTRHSRARMITLHAYGLNACVKNPSSPSYPSVPHLLSTYASRPSITDGIQPSLAIAHRAGGTLRIDEMGSVTCDGKAGVSDSFASALWGADALFAAARAGVDGVNLHTFPKSDNGLFDFTYDRRTRTWKATVHPLYDGALMFELAAPSGSRLLHIVTPAQTSMRAWATFGADRKVRLLLINDSLTASTAVPIHAPSGYANATGTIERLQAPHAGSLSGVTIGGRAFSTTTTGVPPSPRLSTVTPRHGVDTVTVGPASAALVTLSPAS